jgi:hypothetical protein
MNRAVLTGPSAGVFGLCHDWMFQLYHKGYQIFAIDCAIRFHVFRLAELSLASGIPVEETLLKIQVQRAFTPYQILDSLHEIRLHEGSQTIVFLMAPFKQFFDGDVANDEAEFLLEKLNRLVRTFETPILVAEKDSYKHSSFERAHNQLIDNSQIRWFVEQSSQPGNMYPGIQHRTGRSQGKFFVRLETDKKEQIKPITQVYHGKNSSTILTTSTDSRRKVQRLQTGTA